VVIEAFGQELMFNIKSHLIFLNIEKHEILTVLFFYFPSSRAAWLIVSDFGI
jgi:hypothetical protein